MTPRPNRGPVPTDFADVCARLTTKQVEQHYGVGHSVRERWEREVGVTLAKKQRGAAIPADFAELAPTLTRTQLARRYGLTLAKIAVMLEKTKIRPAKPVFTPPTQVLRPVPDDFAQMARKLSRNGLAAHYRSSDVVVRRWCVEANIEPVRARSTGVHRAMAPMSVTASTRDASLAGQAAEHLRRIHASVYRAEILPEAERKHLPAKGRGLFVVSGKGAMTGAALIDLAKAKGFDPNAWARV